nr:MAG TPA: hypothetical protein [Caudoviricetes sp.]
MPVKGPGSLSDGLSGPGRPVIRGERFHAVREALTASGPARGPIAPLRGAWVREAV